MFMVWTAVPRCCFRNLAMFIYNLLMQEVEQKASCFAAWNSFRSNFKLEWEKLILVQIRFLACSFLFSYGISALILFFRFRINFLKWIS